MRNSRKSKFTIDVKESMRKNSTVTDAINVLNNKKFRTTFEVVQGLGNALSVYKEKGNTWALVSGISAALLKVADQFTLYPWDYFDEWLPLMSDDFSGLIGKVITKYPHEDLLSDGNMFIRLHELAPGVRVGYQANKKLHGSINTIYVESENKTAAEEIVRSELWSLFKGKSVVVKKNNSLILRDGDDRIVFREDDFFKPLHSQRADELADVYKKCADMNMPRSLLLYGPPGTGKSTMARSIIDKLGYRSFRVKLSDLYSMDGNTLADAIKIFQPDALILDDLDRSHNQDHLLETLEIFHDQLKLMIATANNTNRFERAVLRPGRFDDMELIEKLDVAVIKKVLGEENQDIFDDVKDWPIVFVEDICKRMKIMSREDAKKSIAELAERVAVICDSEPNDEWETFSNKKKTKKKKGIHALGKLSDEEALAAYELLQEEHEDDLDDDEGN